MSLDHVVVYVTSGTGNTLRVARWFERRAVEGGIDARVMHMEGGHPADELRGGGGELVGLATPTHGFTAPWHAIKFALSMPRGRGAGAFAMATRASVKIGPLFIPGASASCTFVLASILALKGYRVRGVDAFDMPSNWFTLHPPQRRETLDAVIGRARDGADRFADRLLAGDRSWRPRFLLYEGILAVLLSLIACGYMLAGRFFLAKLFFANNRCDGCGICAKGCPVGAIQMWGRDEPRPYWSYHCESCMRCAALCPPRAIESGQSWAVVLYFATALSTLVWALSSLGHWLPWTAGLHEGWIGSLLTLAYFYPALFVSYLLFHLVGRLRPVNWVFAHTTLTHFWGRYMEPGTRYKHLAPRKAHKGDVSE